MARCATEDGLQQANGFLREAVASEKIHVTERLRDEFLRLIVKRGFAGLDGWLGGCFGSIFLVLDIPPGGRRMVDFIPQVFFVKIFRFSALQISHLAEHELMLALVG